MIAAGKDRRAAFWPADKMCQTRPFSAEKLRVLMKSVRSRWMVNVVFVLPALLKSLEGSNNYDPLWLLYLCQAREGFCSDGIAEGHWCFIPTSGWAAGGFFLFAVLFNGRIWPAGHKQVILAKYGWFFLGFFGFFFSFINSKLKIKSACFLNWAVPDPLPCETTRGSAQD